MVSQRQTKVLDQAEIERIVKLHFIESGQPPMPGNYKFAIVETEIVDDKIQMAVAVWEEDKASFMR